MSWWLSWLLWPLVRQGREPRSDFVARTTYGRRSGAYASEEIADGFWNNPRPPDGPEREEDRGQEGQREG